MNPRLVVAAVAASFLLAALAPGCGDPQEPPPVPGNDQPDGGEVEPDGGSCAVDSPPQPAALKASTGAPVLKSGDQILVLANGRVSDIHSGFATNRIENCRILGSELFAYDPAQKGRLLFLGQPDFGPIAAKSWTGPNPRERQKLHVQDLAWDPVQGLWAVAIEPINDEWLLTRLELTDFVTPDQRIGAAFWALPPADHSSRSLYWEDAVPGLAFVDGILYAGTTGEPAAGATRGGQFYRVDVPLPPVYADYPPPNHAWYMAAPAPEWLATLPDFVSVAGDVAGRDGTLWSVAHYGKPGGGPNDVNFLYSLDLASGALTLAPEQIAIAPRDDVEILGEIGGELYGVTVTGKVLKIDYTSGAATLHDDLGPLFNHIGLASDAQVRLRGGAGVTVP